MSKSIIGPGSAVTITDAYGNRIRTRALSGVESVGHTFPVVWVERPLKKGGFDRVPWPAEAVEPFRGDEGESGSEYRG